MPIPNTVKALTYSQEILAVVPERERATVRELQAQAIGYAWGREDAGGQPLDGSWGWDFGMAYLKHAAAYACGMLGFRRNLKDAYECFSQGLDFDDPNVYPARDEVNA